ncbi:MAG: [FeFe] hydrogenase H-cluster radical SAM maturase HydG [Planctomycetes bacterium]|nr:[FeFe] hydrogenase H-cluster radical SAM maturase HydG [Planctomycetota bacterium]
MSAKEIRIDENLISTALEKSARVDSVRVEEVLAKASELKGLNDEDIAVLMNISDPVLMGKLFDTAKEAKDTIYGRRLVIFAPLYISNLCANECSYCAFRASNPDVHRRALRQEEIAQEVSMLEKQGHKRILMVAGESYPQEGFDYVLNSIDTIYGVREGKGEIRRVNVNIAPLTDDEFKRLKERNIGTYQVFQETYHRDTYKKVHIKGKKTDYDWRITSLDRAMEAGINDVGIGVLYGLYDWRYETLAMMQHIRHLEDAYGVGPHTISVPRMEPAIGSDLASHPPQPIDDVTFRKLVAIIRLAVPYTGIIMSTRETANIRRETFALGVSQISAGSRTNPGGYSEGEKQDDTFAQFQLGDHRELDEVIRDVAGMGYIPSFCTGCYRLGRTGQDFMDLAKPGAIKAHCAPNALSTFMEYLIDYASPETRAIGEKAIEDELADMAPAIRERSQTMLDKIRSGERDVYV